MQANLNINWVMAIFSPQPLKKCLFFFAKVTPLKSKNVQFLQWILKEDDVYFKKLQHVKFGGILS